MLTKPLFFFYLLNCLSWKYLWCAHTVHNSLLWNLLVRKIKFIFWKTSSNYLMILIFHPSPFSWIFGFLSWIASTLHRLLKILRKNHQSFKLPKATVILHQNLTSVNTQLRSPSSSVVNFASEFKRCEI